MTFGFMLGAALVMAAAVTLLALMFDINAEGQTRSLVDKAMTKIRVDMTKPDWETRLVEDAKAPVLADRGIAFAIVEPRTRHRLWVSRSDFPAPGDRANRDFHVFPTRIDPTSPYRVLFAVPTKELDELANRRKMEFVALTVLVIGLTGLGTWMLIGKVLSPIGKLSAQAASASTDRLNITLTPPSADLEMVGLVDTLNGLLGRLAQTSAAKGRFYAAASHELRTPLQALSGHLELALTRSRKAEDYEQVISEAHRQTVRLTTLVKDLLLLHQLDTNLPTNPEEVDLLGACRQALEQLQPLFETRAVKVHFEAGEVPPIQSLNSHAEILVRNLLENAAKYADPGTTVVLEVTKGQNGVQLAVKNEFEKASEIEPDRLFEPFYRPDASRNSKTGGNGLGLAICQALASANGWTIRFMPAASSVRVVVAFPEPFAPSASEPKPSRRRGDKLQVVDLTNPSA